MLSRIIRSFNYNVRESEFHLNDINNCPRGHLCKLHYSGSVINPDWQCLAEQLLTDTDSAWLTVIILRWHQQLTVIECTLSQRYLTPTPDSAVDIAHTVTSHHHIVTDNWHWQSLTDTDSRQLTPATGSAWLHPVTYWPGPDFTGRYGRPSFRAWISSALNTSNSSDSLLVGWNSLYTGNGATNFGIWINCYNV